MKVNQIERKYITNQFGKKIAVVLDLPFFEKLLEESEELASIKLYDEGMKEKQKAKPFKKAISKIEKRRN